MWTTIRYFFVVVFVNNTMREIHGEKAVAILDLAIVHDVDYIVLGAFECGAFRNPPEIVADVYKNIFNQQARDRRKKPATVFKEASNIKTVSMKLFLLSEQIMNCSEVIYGLTNSFFLWYS